MATIAPDRIAWGELRSRAQQVRQRAAAAGEAGLSMRVQDLLELLPLPYDPEPLPDDATDEEVAEAEREPLDFAEDVLKRHGVRCRPAPGDVGPDGYVVLRPTNRYAVQGAIGLGLVALAAAAATSKIAAAVFVPVVLVGAWVAWRQAHWLDRWVPRIVPRGRIMGALLMLVLLAVASVAVVNPARDWVRNRGQVRDAVNLSIQAETQLNAGDLIGARASIDQAMQIRPDLGQVQATAQKIMVAQVNTHTSATTNAAFAAQNAYDRAEDAYAAGDWREAIDAFTALGDFADAPTRLAEVRAVAAAATLRRAKAALAAGDASLAFELYSNAVGFDPAVADRTLVKRISEALTAS
ncbi:MAG: hypothetical protein ACO3KD_04380 [Gaiellales bacterium]